MKRKLVVLTVLVGLMLSGCQVWNSGSHVSVTPHKEQEIRKNTQDVTVKNYLALRNALEYFVENGIESAIISMPNFDEGLIKANMDVAIGYVMGDNPIGSYAVEAINYEVGTNSGVGAAAVEIRYTHTLSEIRRIQKVKTISQAKALIAKAMTNCDAGAVMQIEDFWVEDFTQIVEDYAENHPEVVMEMPNVTVQTYPDNLAQNKIVEVKFTYQTSRDDLRVMQQQVKLVFDSAELYVSGDGVEREKYAQLYSFLMERYDYKIQTSITPAYSLLRHGVGDCEAFALVYAAMCREAGLECKVISGTRNGEPWIWNMVRDGDCYYHVDLLRCVENGGFMELHDSAMNGYVWDYSAVPACNSDGIGEPEVESIPTETGELETTTSVSEPPESTVPETIAETVTTEP